MAIKFTKGTGASVGTKTVQKGKVSEPRAESEKLKAGNTMSGAPGYVNTGANGSHGNARGGKPMPMPKANSGLSAKTREIGTKGGSAKRLNSPGKKGAGTMHTGKMESLKGRTKTSWERPGRGKSLMY